MLEAQAIVQVVVLALIQGLSEFLPVSSSAHLILGSKIFGWSDQGLRFDVATHCGTLFAVLAYYRVRLVNLATSSVRGVLQGETNDELRLVGRIVIATLPVLIAGLLFKSAVEAHLRSVTVIGFATVVFGALLLVADKMGKQTADESEVSVYQALLIGIAQATALIPGTSRSGITITAALLFGFTRRASANFSFLLAIPTISAATVLLGMDALSRPVDDVNWFYLGTGVLVSFLSAYLCIDAFLKWIEKIGMTPFVIYRFLIGGVLLAVAYLA
ncbi:MAG: undecaprenyl-diphosphate phosphatase [Gammaproteobacteria bacterium]|nr:undecaprenyl-diphosphate phosphatase [Gammaproteobacteria bacterium]